MKEDLLSKVKEGESPDTYLRRVFKAIVYANKSKKELNDMQSSLTCLDKTDISKLKDLD